MYRWLFLCLCSATALVSSQKLHLHGHQLSPAMMEHLAQNFHVDILVETGTWGGNTAASGSKVFREVYTVELSHDLFMQGKRLLDKIPNAHPFEDNSPHFLQELIPTIHGKILFWLDAHWCGEGTAHNGKNTPIREELEVIRKSGLQNAVILIDDIRCFHNLPEEVFGYGGYPTINQIKELVLAINPSYKFYILGDMAIAFPAEDHVEVSPLVEACTASRLFTIESSDSFNIIELEKKFRLHCYELEAKEIDFLQCLVIPSTEFITFHLILWEGILQLGRAEFAKAATSFEKVLASGYRHWRVSWYLAEAEYALGHMDRTRSLLLHVMKEAPDFQEASSLFSKI